MKPIILISSICLLSLGTVGTAWARNTEGKQTAVVSQLPVKESKVQNKRVSEARHQAVAGVTEINVAPKFSDHVRSYSSQSGRRFTVTTSEREIEFSLERGLSDEVAVRVFTSYGSRETKRSNNDFAFTSKGFSDPSIGLKANRPLNESERVLYGVSLNLGLEANQVAQRDIEGNRHNGGTSVAPYLGYERDLAPGLLAGGDIAYHLRSERKYEGRRQDGTLAFTGTIGGGNETSLSAYIETRQSSSQLGLNANLSFQNSMEDRQDDEIEYADARSFVSLTAYAAFQASEQLTIKPVGGIL